MEERGTNDSATPGIWFRHMALMVSLSTCVSLPRRSNLDCGFHTGVGDAVVGPWVGALVPAVFPDNAPPKVVVGDGVVMMLRLGDWVEGLMLGLFVEIG